MDLSDEALEAIGKMDTDPRVVDAAIAHFNDLPKHTVDRGLSNPETLHVLILAILQIATLPNARWPKDNLINMIQAEIDTKYDMMIRIVDQIDQEQIS